MTQLILATVCSLVLLPRIFGSIEKMGRMKLIQSVSKERTVRLINRSLSDEIAVNHKELATNISKSLKEINRYIIITDYEGTEVFLLFHSDDVYAVGDNFGGRLGFGHKEEVKEPTIIPELSGKKVKDIKCGNSFCVALTQTGQIYTFGTSIGGRTGNGNNHSIHKPIEITVDNQTITAIDSTFYSTFVLTQSGQLYWFGYLDSEMAYKPTNVVFPSEMKIKSFSCGFDHMLALTVEGKVFSWGKNYYGQFSLGHNKNKDIPQKILLNEEIKQVYCGSEHSLLLTTNGKIYSMGNNQLGQLGIGDKEEQNINQVVLNEQEEICCYKDISMSLDKYNKLFIWGNINGTVVSPIVSELNSFQAVVNEYAEYHSTLKPAEIFVNEKEIEEYLQNIENQNASIPIQIERNELIIINLLISDYLLKANDGLKYHELSSIDSIFLKKTNKFIIYTDFWGNEVFLITHSDDVYAFGRNYLGRLGFEHKEEVKEPKIIPELCGKKVIDIKCGEGFCVALTQTGQIYTFGQIGQNGNNQKPISVDNQTITAIDCTRSSIHALTQSGQLYWFGFFWWNSIKAYTPTKVAFPLDVQIKSISCGEDHVLALTVEGTVYSWGANSFGQLGLGVIYTHSPQMIKLNESIDHISAGDSHSLLLTTNGKVYSMGSNKFGQLGNRNYDDQNIPQLVLTEQKEICSYEYISMSVDLNNKLYAWGNIRAVNSPILSELSSFQRVVNKYAKYRSTLKPIVLLSEEKQIKNSTKT